MGPLTARGPEVDKRIQARNHIARKIQEHIVMEEVKATNVSPTGGVALERGPASEASRLQGPGQAGGTGEDLPTPLGPEGPGSFLPQVNKNRRPSGEPARGRSSFEGRKRPKQGFDVRGTNDHKTFGHLWVQERRTERNIPGRIVARVVRTLAPSLDDKLAAASEDRRTELSRTLLLRPFAQAPKQPESRSHWRNAGEQTWTPNGRPTLS